MCFFLCSLTMHHLYSYFLAPDMLAAYCKKKEDNSDF